MGGSVAVSASSPSLRALSLPHLTFNLETFTMLHGGIELPRRFAASSSPSPRADVRVHRTGSISVDMIHSGGGGGSGGERDVQQPFHRVYNSDYSSKAFPASPYVSLASRLPLQSTPESYANSRRSRQSPLSELGTPFRAHRSPYHLGGVGGGGGGGATRDEQIARMEEELFRERQRAIAAYVDGMRNGGDIAPSGVANVLSERDQYLHEEQRHAPYQVSSERELVEER